MSGRNASGNAAKANSKLIFRHLLRVNKLREVQLRRQLSFINKQQQALLAEQQRCRSHHDEVAIRLKALLFWQGTSSCRMLMEKKRKMSALFIQEHKLMAEQCQLQDKQQQLKNQSDEIQQKLNLLMKKNEKIKKVLADEHHQS